MRTVSIHGYPPASDVASQKVRSQFFFSAGCIGSNIHASSNSSLQRRRSDTQAVSVPEEQDALAITLSFLAGLNKLAPARARPDGPDEAEGTAASVGAVVLAHDGANGLASLVRVVEGNGADVMVEDVCLDNAVEEVAANPAHVAIDGRSGAANEVPLLSLVVGQGRIGVLQESDGNCVNQRSVCAIFAQRFHASRRWLIYTYPASGSPTSRE